MGRPRKLFKHSEGPHGETVSIREPRLGAPLRWDFREHGERKRPEVYPRIVVRKSAGEPVDPALEQKAIELCKKKSAELTLTAVPVEKSAPKKLTHAETCDELTVLKAYALYFAPGRKALPESREAQTHHKGSRAFWEKEIGYDEKREPRRWNEIPPADVRGALWRLKATGKVPTADKRLRNLRTLHRWLRDMMNYDLLRDPTRGVDLKKLREGYKPNRSRLTADDRLALRKVVPSLKWRSRLFYTLMTGSGTRAVQARSAKRSGLDAKLQPMPKTGEAQFGWFVFGGVKGQRPHVTHLTWRQRLEIARAIWGTWEGEKFTPGPLAHLEARYQAGEIPDYYLIPGGREDRGELVDAPISDRILRYELDEIFARAGIVKTDRMGFHAVRRGFGDVLRESEGLDVVQSAGGWSRRETVEESYVSEVQHGDLERARRQMEKEEGNE